MTQTHISYSLNDTHELAKKWAGEISAGREDAREALVVGLSGSLGSGKTAFVQEVVRSLGNSDALVSSPTFVIMKSYEIGSTGLGTAGPFRRVLHIDAYRLERSEELEALNFEQWLEDPTNLILIEWPENVKKILPPAAKMIRFEHVEDGVRKIIFPHTS